MQLPHLHACRGCTDAWAAGAPRLWFAGAPSGSPGPRGRCPSLSRGVNSQCKGCSRCRRDRLARLGLPAVAGSHACQPALLAKLQRSRSWQVAAATRHGDSWVVLAGQLGMPAAARQSELVLLHHRMQRGD